MVNKIEREELLKNSYRMFHKKEDDNGINRTHGLFMLVNDFINEESIVAEIGSFAGVSSEVFALNCKKIFCIDTWEDWNNDGIIYDAMSRFDNIKSMYNNVEKLHMTGNEASRLFEDNFFDFVYIDASHFYDEVVGDIKTWLPKIKKGGYLGGHDYVKEIDSFRAVNDFFGKTHSITIYPDSSWVIKNN